MGFLNNRIENGGGENGASGARGPQGVSVTNVTSVDNNNGTVDLTFHLSDSSTIGPITNSLVSDILIALNKIELSGTDLVDKITVKDSLDNVVFNVDTVTSNTTISTDTVNISGARTTDNFSVLNLFNVDGVNNTITYGANTGIVNTKCIKSLYDGTNGSEKLSVKDSLDNVVFNVNTVTGEVTIPNLVSDASASHLKTTGTDVSVNTGANPTADMLLIATDANTAVWKIPDPLKCNSLVTNVSSGGTNGVRIGSFAGQTNQIGTSVAVGYYAGQTDQKGSAVAVGHGAGNFDQKGGSIAIGSFAGASYLGTNAVAIGNLANGTIQGINNGNHEYSIAIGHESIALSDSVGIGRGVIAQSKYCVAIGNNAKCLSGLNLGDVAIGINSVAGQQSVSIGASTGGGIQSVSVGYTLNNVGGDKNVVIGHTQTNSGYNGITIGQSITTTHNNNICLNATTNVVTSTKDSAFYVDPIALETGNQKILTYDTTTKEIGYSTITSDVIDNGNIPLPTTDGFVEANKIITADVNRDVTNFRNISATNVNVSGVINMIGAANGDMLYISNSSIARLAKPPNNNYRLAYSGTTPIWRLPQHGTVYTTDNATNRTINNLTASYNILTYSEGPGLGSTISGSFTQSSNVTNGIGIRFTGTTGTILRITYDVTYLNGGAYYVYTALTKNRTVIPETFTMTYDQSGLESINHTGTVILTATNNEYYQIEAKSNANNTISVTSARIVVSEY